MVLGFATGVVGGALWGNASPKGSLWRPGLGGVMLGVGASAALVGGYVLVALPIDPGRPVPSLAVGTKF